jgi:hypothetical protein
MARPVSGPERVLRLARVRGPCVNTELPIKQRFLPTKRAEGRFGSFATGAGQQRVQPCPLNPPPKADAQIQTAALPVVRFVNKQPCPTHIDKEMRLSLSVVMERFLS